MPQKVIVDVDETTFSVTNDLNNRTLDIINSNEVSLLLQDISNYDEFTNCPDGKLHDWVYKLFRLGLQTSQNFNGVLWSD